MIKQNYEERKIDICMGLIRCLMKKKPKLDGKTSDLISRIEEVFTRLERYTRNLNESKDDWKMSKLNEQNTLWTKVIQKGEVMVRFEGDVPVDIFNLATMINETDIYKDWLLFCTDSREIL